MKEEKKKRAPNFTFVEKENFLSLVAKYQDTVDCRKTGAFYAHKKRKVWHTITKQFNSYSSTLYPREEIQLKHFYENMKHRARKRAKNKQKDKTQNDLSSVSIIISDHSETETYDERNENVTEANNIGELTLYSPSQPQTQEPHSASVPRYRRKKLIDRLRNGIKKFYRRA